MSEGIHKVVLYVNEQAKQFTITARMDRARLPGVDEQMSQPGWTRTEIGKALDKDRAEVMRDHKRAELVAKGYSYQTRLPLS